MTLTTEQLRARAESLGLDFFIERRAGIWVKEWFNNGCTSATAEEVMMWSMLANREAQPVLYASEETLAYAKEGEKSLVTWSEPMGDAVIPLFTTPPAPAVPGEMTGGIAMSKYKVKKSNYVQWVKGFNACRAAMLAQPVSGGYTFNSPEIPDGWKLVPIDATRAMIDAAQRVEEDGYDAMHKAMLAAAPEGGNG